MAIREINYTVVDGVRSVKSDITHHVGCVVSTSCVERRIMSDVWDYVTIVTVWDEETLTFKTIDLHHFNCGQWYEFTAEVDATEWNKAKWLAHCEVMRRKAAEEKAKQAAEAAEIERWTPRKGKYVEVIKGRKVAKGTKGLVFWTGYDSYGKPKLGIAVSERKDYKGLHLDVVWTAESNCAVVEEKVFYTP